MTPVLLAAGVASFGCMALSDWLCVIRGNSKAGALFPAGCVLLAAVTAGMLGRTGFPGWNGGRVLFLVPALGMLGLLVYSVAGILHQGGSSALPPAPGQKRPLVSTGVYALCRHPGVLWLGGFYGFLWLTFGGWDWFLAAVLFTAADGVYAWWQDQQVFPRSIADYLEYQKGTPFLLPTRDSIRRSIERR